MTSTQAPGDAVTNINYLPQLAEQLASTDADVSGWLGRHGLSLEDLQDANRQLPIKTYRALIEDALEMTGETGIGFLVGRRLDTSAHGILGLAAGSAGTILDAMRIVETYVALRTSLVVIRAEEEGDFLNIVFETQIDLGSAAGMVADAAIIAIKTIIDGKAAPLRLQPTAVFAYPEPPHSALARDMLDCPIRYGHSWTGLRYPIADARRDIAQHDPLVMSEALAVCQRALDRLSSATTTTARLERLLLEKKVPFPTLGVAARLFNMTPRTLHRRLDDENTSYREVLESVRSRLALEYLQTRKMSVKEVAYLLGYNDISNFRRAFKRWHGVPPSQI